MGKSVTGKNTYQWQGKSVQGKSVEFETEREEFNLYILRDGSKLQNDRLYGWTPTTIPVHKRCDYRLPRLAAEDRCFLVTQGKISASSTALQNVRRLDSGW